jgi:NAD(P)-dependent dehydrogenase (short-subunit alcohol dehydrogenase family)
MSCSVLVVIGSGPGIGVATASIFARRKFDKIALISRDGARLQQDRATILQTATAAGRDVEVSTFAQDVCETISFQKTLKRVEELGVISCVHFNAARVHPSNLLTYDEKDVVEDFVVFMSPLELRTLLKSWQTTNIGLLTTARWAMPLLMKATDKPTLLVTGGMLWYTPVPEFFSLSMVKTSQRNLVRTLEMTYPDVNIAQVNVGGVISVEDKIFNPNAIGEKLWEVYAQEKDQWTSEVNILAS